MNTPPLNLRKWIVVMFVLGGLAVAANLLSLLVTACQAYRSNRP